MMRSKIFFSGLIIIVILILSACQSGGVVFEQHQKMERMSWDRFNILVFEIPVEDPTKEYDFIINIRHIPEAPYKEMEVNFTLYTPSDDMRTNNRVIPFIDRDNKALSNCLGDLCDLEFPLRRNFKFNERGIARIEIENRNTRVKMPGIIEVGLIMRESIVE